MLLYAQCNLYSNFDVGILISVKQQDRHLIVDPEKNPSSMTDWLRHTLMTQPACWMRLNKHASILNLCPGFGRLQAVAVAGGAQGGLQPGLAWYMYPFYRNQGILGGRDDLLPSTCRPPWLDPEINSQTHLSSDVLLSALGLEYNWSQPWTPS